MEEAAETLATHVGANEGITHKHTSGQRVTCAGASPNCSACSMPVADSCASTPGPLGGALHQQSTEAWMTEGALCPIPGTAPHWAQLMPLPSHPSRTRRGTTFPSGWRLEAPSLILPSSCSSWGLSPGLLPPLHQVGEVLLPGVVPGPSGHCVLCEGDQGGFPLLYIEHTGFFFSVIYLSISIFSIFQFYFYIFRYSQNNYNSLDSVSWGVCVCRPKCPGVCVCRQENTLYFDCIKLINVNQ